MNIHFTGKQEKYIQALLASGDYRDASEVVEEALRLHEFYRDKLLTELRKEIDKGWDGKASRRSVKGIVAEKHKSRHAE